MFIPDPTITKKRRGKTVVPLSVAMNLKHLKLMEAQK
jgi:hypothetical protein